MSEPSDNRSTRWSLVRRLSDPEDQRAWEDFYAIYGRLIHGFGVKAGLTSAEAEDAVQDTLASLVENLQEFDVNPEAGSFKSWLFTLARWRILNRLGDRRRFERWLSQGRHDTHPKDTSSTPTLERVPDPVAGNLEALWEQEWRDEVLDIALAKLKRVVDPKHYQIFYLHFVKQQSPGTVAKALGVRVGQVYLVKYRLLRQLKSIVKKIDEAPP